MELLEGSYDFLRYVTCVRGDTLAAIRTRTFGFPEKFHIWRTVAC
jgi:hypothetical protein